MFCKPFYCVSGGTFTDIYCEIGALNEDVECRVIKLLSEDPSNYADAPTEGIRRILQQELGISLPRSELVPTDAIEYIRMGTTVATNALLERKGEKVALITTKGFADLQLIGNQSRPKIFDLRIQRPDLLYERVIEVDERVTLLKDEPSSNQVYITGISQERLIIEKSLDEADVKEKLEKLICAGIKSIAVVLMHSYTFSQHEKKIQEIAESLGFEQISLSCEVMPMVRIVPRGCTTCVDAYLTPIIKRYLQSFSRGFDAGLANVKVSFMQSDGGLTPMNSFFGNRCV